MISGDFGPNLRLEDFARNTLALLAKEFCLDVHLLMRAAYWHHLSGLEWMKPTRAAVAGSVVIKGESSWEISTEATSSPGT